MAQRDLDTRNTVLERVGEQPSQLPQVVAEIGTNILKQGQEAKINEGISKVQLDLNKMQTEYQIKNEKNPGEGLAEFQQKRQELFDSYGENISPLYRRYWNDSVRKIGAQNDLTQQGWVLKQTRINTVNSINDSMQNNFKLAAINGQNYGNSDETEIGAALDFRTSKGQLAGFASKNLGTETADHMLKGYDDDYMKSFLSGVSDVNPIKALNLMSDPRVMASFKDIKHFNSMKESIENRALNAGKIASRKEVLDAMKGENSLLGQSLTEPMGYTDLQNEMDRLNLSPKSRDFFLEANGFAKEQTGGKLNAEQQGELKDQVYNRILSLGKDGTEITADQIKDLQSDVYGASQKGALTKKETAQWLNQVLNPLIEQKEQTMSKFSDNGYFWQDSLGLDGIKEQFDKSVAITPTDGKDLSPLAQRHNMQNRIKMYDSYMGYLGSEASKRQMNVGDILKLPTDERRQIYARAQTAAIKSFNSENYPELTNMKDTPNAVIPVFSNPAQLQPTYETKSGKSITKEEILQTAKNRNKSPDEIIQLLRQKGVLK